MARNGALQVTLGFALKLGRAGLLLQVPGSEAGPPSIPEVILGSKPHICCHGLVTTQEQPGNSPPRLCFSSITPWKVQVSLQDNKHFPEAPPFAPRHQPGIQDPPGATKWMKMSLCIWDCRNQPPPCSPQPRVPRLMRTGM